MTEPASLRALALVCSLKASPAPSSSELIARQLLEELRPQYEFIIMDSPPAGFVSDTLSLLLNAPQSIIIARQNHAVYN